MKSYNNILGCHYTVINPLPHILSRMCTRTRIIKSRHHPTPQVPSDTPVCKRSEGGVVRDLSRLTSKVYDGLGTHGRECLRYYNPYGKLERIRVIKRYSVPTTFPFYLFTYKRVWIELCTTDEDKRKFGYYSNSTLRGSDVTVGWVSFTNDGFSCVSEGTPLRYIIPRDHLCLSGKTASDP